MRAWDKKVELELVVPGGTKRINLSLKEGVEILSDTAVTGYDRMVMKTMLAIMEEIDRLDPLGAIKSPRLRDACEKLDESLRKKEAQNSETWDEG